MSKVKGNIGVERVVLAGICQFGKDAYYDVSDIISPNTFSLDANQALYKCLEKVLTQIDKPDATSIMAAADSLGLSDLLTRNKIDVEYIRSLFAFPIKELKNVRPHAKQLAKIDIIRKEQAALYQAQRELDEFDGTETVDKILGIGEAAVFGLINELNTQTEENPKQIVTGTREKLTRLLEKPIENIGIPTPWPIYNKLIGNGIRPGVALIGARPKCGKSTLAINCGLHVAQLGIPTLYVDTEMVQDEQDNRIVACSAEVNSELIETGKFEDYKKEVWAAIDKLEKLPFYHKWVGGANFEEILSIIRRWLYKDVGFNEFGKPKPHFIIYDYFKLMNESGLTGNVAEYQKIGFQISYLSDFCKLYGTPTLAFVQVNRDGITKDTSDIISMSDRLLWLCTSCSVMKKLSKEEISENGGRRFGNRRLSIIEGRFAKEFDEGDCILFDFQGDKSRIKELGTRYALQKQNQINDTGFEIEDDKTGDNT